MIRNGLEDLPLRIDLSLISEITVGTCAPFPTNLRGEPTELTMVPGSPVQVSELSFSLIGASGNSISDHIAMDRARWADWVDGLNMVRSGGHVASNETDKYVQALTEIGLKIRLLSACCLVFACFSGAMLMHFCTFRLVRR